MKSTHRFIILLFSGVFVCLFASGCNHFLYPSSRGHYIEKKHIKPVPDDVFINVGRQGIVHGWLFKTTQKTKKGVAIHFHGNGQNISTHFQFFLWLVDQGFDYFIFDYRGYGISTDNQAIQEKTVEDGLAVLKYIKEKYPDTPVVAIGQSLGSNVLLRALQETTAEYYPSMVVMDSSFTSYQQAARSTLKQRWFLYPFIPLTYLVISDKWAAIKKLDQSPSLPALFYQSEKDTIIRSELSEENYQAWKGPKTQVIDKEGYHISAFGDPNFYPKNRAIFLNCVNNILNKKPDFENCADIKPSN